EDERGLAGRRSLRHRPQHRFRVGVTAALDRSTGLQCDDGRIVAIELVRERVDLVEFPLDEGARRVLQRRLGAPRRLGGPGAREGEDDQRDYQEKRASKLHRGSYYI